MFSLPLALTLGALLHNKALHPGQRQRSVHVIHGVRIASAASLDHGFVSDLYDRCFPFVALVMPRGMPNMTSRKSGFVISVNCDRYVLTSGHIAAGGTMMEVTLPANDSPSCTTCELLGAPPAWTSLSLCSRMLGPRRACCSSSLATQEHCFWAAL